LLLNFQKKVVSSMSEVEEEECWRKPQQDRPLHASDFDGAWSFWESEKIDRLGLT